MRPKKSKLDSTNAEALSIARTDPSRAKKMADWALAEAQTLNYLKGQADAMRVHTQVLAESDPEMANDISVRAIRIYEQVGEESLAATLLMGVAKFNQNSGWVSRAHYILVSAYDKAVRTGNDKVRMAALFNLGVNAEDRSDFEAALEYFRQAEEAARLYGDDHVAWRAECAKHEMYFRLQDDRFLLPRVHEARAALSGEGNEESQIEVLLLMAKVAESKGDVLLARSYLKEGFGLAKLTENELAKAEILLEFGNLREKEGRLGSAKTLFTAALKASMVLGVHTLRLSCLRNLSRVLLGLGRPNEAFEALNQYVALNEDLNRQESERHFEEMRMAHQVQIVEEESKMLKRRNTELGMVNARLEAALLETQKLQKELQRLVTIDELTGAMNRREILAKGSEIVARFHSQGRPGAVMIVDIDHFKSINDGFGHATGDEVLRRFTKSCQRVLRPTDFFGRLGGEEFCILLDRTKADIAAMVAERVMRSIRSTRVDDLMGDRVVTASIGLVEIQEGHNTIEEALNDADTCLYEAKQTGRDKICVHGVKKKKAA